MSAIASSDVQFNNSLTFLNSSLTLSLIFFASSFRSLVTFLSVGQLFLLSFSATIALTHLKSSNPQDLYLSYL